jgi:uncharacterized protein (TIGR03083 family)
MEITAASVAADLTRVRSEGDALARVAGSAWDEAVPTCPGWDVGTVLTHTGGAHRWALANLTAGTRVRRSQVPPPPDGREARLDWYTAGLRELEAAAATVDPMAEVWTFAATGERRAAWWVRRMACETAIHRWDAAAALTAAGGPRPDAVDARLAVAGIDEYLSDFLPRLPPAMFAGWSGTLHLHATDVDGEWVVDLGNVALPPRREHTKADTAVRGPASDVLLWLWNRQGPEHLEAFGDTAVLERWRLVTI